MVRLSADRESVPGTLWPLLLSIRETLPGVMVNGLMGALNTAVGAIVFETPVASDAGVMVAVGRERAVWAPVVKLWVTVGIALPARSTTPAMVSVYRVLSASR